MAVEFNEGYIKDISEISERGKSNSHRIDNIETEIKSLKEENKAIYSIASSIELLCHKTDEIKETVEENTADIKQVKTEVETIKEQPYKVKSAVYDKVIAAILGAVGTGIIMFILNQIAPHIFT